MKVKIDKLFILKIYVSINENDKYIILTKQVSSVKYLINELDFWKCESNYIVFQFMEIININLETTNFYIYYDLFYNIKIYFAITLICCNNLINGSLLL